MVVKIFRSAHVAPTLTPSTDLNSALCSAHSDAVSAGRSSARFVHLSHGTRASGKGTRACSGVDLTSQKDVERMSLRRVPSWSATTISSETCWPAGRSIWNTRYGCLSPTARAMRGLGRVSVRSSGRSRGPARARAGAKSRGEAEEREKCGNAGGRSRPRLSSAGSCIFSPGGPVTWWTYPLTPFSYMRLTHLPPSIFHPSVGSLPCWSNISHGGEAGSAERKC